MNINYITTWLLLGLGALLWSGCNDILNLEPQQSISQDQALESEENIKAVLVGAYNALGNSDIFGGNNLRDAELLGGDGEVFWVGTFNAPGEIFAKTMISTNLDAQETWLESYETINICNNVLDPASLEQINEEDRPVVEGEALFIRSLCYFDLVRLYAQQYLDATAASEPGVPLVLTPTRNTSEALQVPRNTVAEVYDQIIADLTTAVTQLPTSNGFFATSGAAQALLARVYLQQGDYASARDAASAVIESGGYGLEASYRDAFNRDGNGDEDIFAMQVTTQDGANNMVTFFATPQFGGRDGDIEVLQAHLDLYDSTDARLDLFYFDAGAARSGKWTNQFGNVGLIRLAEMFLIRAEGNLREGTEVGATPLEDYNALHTRAGLPAATEVTLDDVLLERRLELAHEGHKIHDLRRLQQDVGGRPFDAPELVFPIPQREMTANPALTQNPGYQGG